MLRAPGGLLVSDHRADRAIRLSGAADRRRRPQFPDLNVVVHGRQTGKILLSTSHEIPAEFPLGQPPPHEEYDHLATGAITSLLARIPTSRSRSPRTTPAGWSTTARAARRRGERSSPARKRRTLSRPITASSGKSIPTSTRRSRLDDCGRFEHEAAVDRPQDRIRLSHRGLRRRQPALPDEAEEPRETWPREESSRPTSLRVAGSGSTIHWGRTESSPPRKGSRKELCKFARLEGTARSGPLAVLHRDRRRHRVREGLASPPGQRYSLELWAQGRDKGRMCMPDNLVFDAAGNMFVTEDKGGASSENQNKILYIDQEDGKNVCVRKAVGPPGPAVRGRADGPVLRSQDARCCS